MTNNVFHINSNYAHIHLGFLYLGWNNHSRFVASEMDCGDETFGICIGNFYIGCYSGTGWCAGFLNENGILE